MSIFQTDETAWSAMTKALENVIQPTGSTIIVQAPTTFRPLAIQAGIDPRLAMFRKLLVADKIPTYGNKNKNSYVATGASVQDAYGQYLQALNNALIERFAPTADQSELTGLKNTYNRALAALRAFERAANDDWKAKKRADPTLTRYNWDQGYGQIGFTPEKNQLEDEVDIAYGTWQAKAKPFPELTRVVRAIRDYNDNPLNKIQLPCTEDELGQPSDSWTPYLKTNIDIEDFFTHDAEQSITLTQTSSTSSSYESRWSASGSVSYGFFSVGGSASGGNIERHLQAGTQNLSYSFARLEAAQVLRGHWYDEGLLRQPYIGYVDKAEYWTQSGQLPLVPTTILIGRGLKVSVTADSTSYSEFQSWYNRGGSGGFSFGPWSVGASANSSASSSTISNTSAGSTISFTDNSNTPYVLAVVSLKMEEWLANRALSLQFARDEMHNLIREAEEFELRNPNLVLSEPTGGRAHDRKKAVNER